MLQATCAFSAQLVLMLAFIIDCLVLSSILLLQGSPFMFSELLCVVSFLHVPGPLIVYPSCLSSWQATRGLREGEDAFVRIGEALDLNGRNSNLRYVPSDPTHGDSALQERTTSCKLEATSGHIPSPNDGSEVQFPIEMISNCVATLFVIQVKTC